MERSDLLEANGKIFTEQGRALAAAANGEQAARTGANGTFTIRKVLRTKGTYRVYVTIPAGTGNVNGTSPTRTATVR
jgi:hypothetical protein